jgi:hypothetical protein
VFTYVYSRYALCLLLQILFLAALDIKTRDVPTVSSINSLLSQYCKASFFFKFLWIWGEGAPTVRLAPVVPWAKTGPAYIVPTKYTTLRQKLQYTTVQADHCPLLSLTHTPSMAFKFYINKNVAKWVCVRAYCRCTHKRNFKLPQYGHLSIALRKHDCGQTSE